MVRLSLLSRPFAAMLLIAGTASVSQAQMVLTSAGITAGYSLTTFATGFPSSGNVGPLGTAFLPGGGVLVTDYPGNIRLFATDTDGQSAASAPVTQNYGFANAVDLAQSGGNIYMTRQGIGDLVQVNNNGAFNQVIVTGMPVATGTAVNPNNGHIFISTGNTNIIYDVDPIAKTKTQFINAIADGLTFSANGLVLYGAINNRILGYNVATHAQIFDSGVIPGGVDGSAVGTGAFSNFVFTNTNSGQLFQINLTTSVQTLIATGGSRGDFVTVDPTNNTLLLTQTDRILRLSGASFVPVPEPGSIALLIGLSVAGVFARRRRRASA